MPDPSHTQGPSQTLTGTTRWRKALLPEFSGLALYTMKNRTMTSTPLAGGSCPVCLAGSLALAVTHHATHLALQYSCSLCKARTAGQPFGSTPSYLLGWA